MDKFEIPKNKGKSRHTKAPKCERERETCEDGNEQKIQRLRAGSQRGATRHEQKESTTKRRQMHKRRQWSRSQTRKKMQRHLHPRQQQMDNPSQRLTRQHSKGRSHRRRKKRQKKTKKFGPSYKKGRRRRSKKKNESVKSAKRSKIYIRENIRTKRQEKSEYLEKVKGTRNIPRIKSIGQEAYGVLFCLCVATGNFSAATGVC